jgi:hypothetical protein
MLPGMSKNKDDSLTIYIQKDAPSADKRANWLPAPDGPIQMVMRLYFLFGNDLIDRPSEIRVVVPQNVSVLS